uniref:Sushi domain-containing protein n=1 Tax=Meloidogyne incognita TaxID=6306 RepID=A0A914LYN3_MELIC
MFSSSLNLITKIFILLTIFFNYGIFGCNHNGITYHNGDEWLEKNAFVVRCTVNSDKSWRSEVVACVLPDSRRVPILTSLEDGNSVWKCEKNDEDRSVQLRQAPSNNALCNGIRPVGSVWQEKSFELECLPGGYTRLRACVTEEGNRVKINTTSTVNGFDVECIQFYNGTIIFRGAKPVPRVEPIVFPQPIRSQYGAAGPIITPAVRCTDESGRPRHVGDYWTENHRFNKTCREGGAVEVVNCVSKDGYRVPLNGQMIQNGYKFECVLTPHGTIKFSSLPVTEG